MASPWEVNNESGQTARSDHVYPIGPVPKRMRRESRGRRHATVAKLRPLAPARGPRLPRICPIQPSGRHHGPDRIGGPVSTDATQVTGPAVADAASGASPDETGPQADPFRRKERRPEILPRSLKGGLGTDLEALPAVGAPARVEGQLELGDRVLIGVGFG